MKKNYTLFLLFFAFVGYSQIPTGYYDAATGTGYALKTQLKTIITTNHIDKGYGGGTSQTNNGLWSAYGLSDRDNGIGYENDNTIVDIYSEKPTSSDPYNFNFNVVSGTSAGQCGSGGANVEGDCYNREHLIPQSYFGGSNATQNAIMRNDIQHVYPTDKWVNNIRNDYAFGKVNIATYTSQNGSKLGSALNSGYSIGFVGTVFEPIDEFKGDVARAYFYFATRYEDQMNTLYTTYTSVDARVMFDGSINKVFSATFLNILLTWNAQDPVSLKETKRNNASYNHQGNRNPFIDNNAYVTSIWGVPLEISNFDLATMVSISPNPTSDNKVTINTTLILDEIQIVNINGQIVQQLTKPNFIDNNFVIENLNSGFYFVRLVSENQTVTKKILVN